MIYFTSDLHLGHANIIRHCNRPFSSVEKMDETLIRNWAKRVKANDTVYVLGDLMFRNQKSPEEYLSRLKGKKHLIIGNHDKDWIKKCKLEDFFESVNGLDYFSDGQHQMTLCHFPMMSWPHNTKAYMVCTIRSGLEHREAAEKIEDEFDLKAHDRALAEYRKIPKTFTHAEVCRMLESEE